LHGSFIDATPTARLVRQVLGAISEFDKAMTVAKLRGARERKRRGTGKCEGSQALWHGLQVPHDDARFHTNSNMTHGGSLRKFYAASVVSSIGSTN
jgi:hypothetical protein